MVGHHAAHTTLKYYAKMDKQTVFDELREKGVANDVKSGKKKSQVTPERRTTPKTATLTANTAAILDEIRTRGIPMSEGEE